MKVLTWLPSGVLSAWAYFLVKDLHLFIFEKASPPQAGTNQVYKHKRAPSSAAPCPAPLVNQRRVHPLGLNMVFGNDSFPFICQCRLPKT